MTNIDQLVRDYLTKEAGIGQSAVNVGKKVGQGAWNIAMGGKTVAGQWKPLQGFSEMGRAKKVYADGPLKGMRMLDPKAGSPVLEESRNWLKYLAQEIQGSHPTRGDVFSMQQAKRTSKLMPTSGGFKSVKLNPGEYLAKAQKDPAIAKQIGDINSMAVTDFIRKYPRTAARYFGGQAAYKGMMIGVPAYEGYNLLAKGRGHHPEEGRGANLGSSLGTNLGFLASMPLGWVGAPLAAGVAGGMGRRVGRGVDKLMGNKPIGSMQISSLPSSESQLPFDAAAGEYPPQGRPRYRGP